MPAPPASTRRCRCRTAWSGSTVVASANHMPVWGGVEMLLGTNPVAIAIPAGEEAPVVLDIATSVVSYGTVKSHRLQDKPMPEGWMVSPRTVRRSPMRRAAAKGCCCRSAATRASGCRSCSVCWPDRSTARRSAATCSISTTTTPTSPTPGSSSSRSTSSASRRSTVQGRDGPPPARSAQSKPLPGVEADPPAGPGAPHAPRGPRSRTACRCRAN